jgi:propionyl-CoA carboxylase beta chain
VTHEEVSFEELGGADTHARRSGVAHFAVPSEEECLAGIRELLTFLPANNLEDPPIRHTLDPVDRMDEALQRLVPANPTKPYDMKELIQTVLDDHDFLEVQPDYADRSASSPTSPPTWRGASTSRRRSRAPASSGSATASTCRW